MERVCLISFALLLVTTQSAVAQGADWKSVQIQDVQVMADKFAGLAEAFDESQYDWRPMEGVRSVREVLGLTVAEANLFPTVFGLPPAAHAAAGFEAEMERASALDKAAMLDELARSFGYFVEVLDGMSGAKRFEMRDCYGTEMEVHACVAVSAADMHEHLGQLIAYARANRVVPPWSR